MRQDDPKPKIYLTVFPQIPRRPAEESETLHFLEVGGKKALTFKRKLGRLRLRLAVWLHTYESNHGAPHPPRSRSQIEPNCSRRCQELVYDRRSIAAFCGRSKLHVKLG